MNNTPFDEYDSPPPSPTPTLSTLDISSTNGSFSSASSYRTALEDLPPHLSHAYPRDPIFNFFDAIVASQVQVFLVDPTRRDDPTATPTMVINEGDFRALLMTATIALPPHLYIAWATCGANPDQITNHPALPVERALTLVTGFALPTNLALSNGSPLSMGIARSTGFSRSTGVRLALSKVIALSKGIALSRALTQPSTLVWTTCRVQRFPAGGLALWTVQFGLSVSPEAFLLLNGERESLEQLVVKLDAEVYKLLHAVGFSTDPSTWRKSARDVVIKLNREYRYLAKWEIQRAAWRIRHTEGYDHLAAGLTTRTEVYSDLRSRFGELRSLYQRNAHRLSETDKAGYKGLLGAHVSAMQFYKEKMDDATERIKLYKPLFRLLNRPHHIISIYVDPLDVPCSIKGTVVSIRRNLVSIRETMEARAVLTKRAEVLYTEVSDLLMGRGYLPRDYFNAKLAEYATVTASIRAQEECQGNALAELKTYLDTVRSTPRTLPGPDPDTEVTVASLRQAPTHFEEINRAIISMSRVERVIRSGLQRDTDRLKQALAVIVIVRQ
ncbi:hypothetical protein C8Q76DRAFT_693731 [Earliella scabrosa]|nr:hypothetical protein C8Q76DRAFT_693731 [Earliella scabrosa]